MTIKVFPSRLPGEPLEVHQHGEMSIHDWMNKNVKGYSLEAEHKLCIEVSGREVKPEDWPLTLISPESDVRVYPKPFGIETALIITAAVISVASAVYSIIMMSQLNKAGASTSNGDQLDLNPAKANTARLGDPIRELFGRFRIYPDYLNQPVSRFDESNREIYRSSMFLSLGRGNFSVPASGVKIGSTPVSAFGSDVTYTIYPPGADLSNEPRADIWYSSPEVGGTTSGTAGLDMESTAPTTSPVSADAVVLSGNTFSLIGNESGDGSGDTELPEGWVAGVSLTLKAPDTFTVAHEGGVSVIYGDLTELTPSVGQLISLSFNGTDYDLAVKSYSAGTPAVPGQGGSASSLTGSAAPTTYDFSSTPVAFTVNWAGVAHVISLTANYMTMTGVTEEITDQLTGTPLIAQDSSGRLQIIESSSPYSGNAITTGSLPTAIFGASPVNVAGTASTGGTPEVLPSIKMAYNTADGADFAGLPAGTQRLAISSRAFRHRITAIDGVTVTVERMKTSSSGSGYEVDTTWPGFTSRTILDFAISSLNENISWIGPFLCCPENEVTEEVEINFTYPSGLSDLNNKGLYVRFIIQYREFGSSTWISLPEMTHWGSTSNQIGWTHKITMPSPGAYEFRARRTTFEDARNRDAMQWQALRSKLKVRPNSYADVTTMAITVRTGNRIAAQSDRRINMLATRIYDGATARSISGALRLVIESLGMTADMDTINEMEETIWTPNGDHFDFSTSDSTSALEILQNITQAAKSYFLFTEGMASVGYDGVKPWTGMITPSQQTEMMTTAFKAVTDDDYDGVDVTYISSTTWAEETIECRMPGSDTAFKVEDFTLNGVTDPDKAYQIGMRRLLKYQLQRLSYTASTTLAAMCYNVGDRVILTDDIPDPAKSVTGAMEAITTSGAVSTIAVSEPLDWPGVVNPVVVIGYQDGTVTGALQATRIDDFRFSVPYQSEFDNIDLSFEAGEPPTVVFSDAVKVGYSATISDISPGSDGNSCEVTALQYDEKFYQYDSSVAP